MDRPMETRHLAIADRNIAAGKARVDDQLALLEQLKLRGANTETAENFLVLLRLTLVEWNLQREMIVQELERSQNLS